MDFELYLKSRILKEHSDIDFNDLNFLYLLNHYNGIYNKMLSSYNNVDVNILNGETKKVIDKNIKDSLFNNFITNLDNLSVDGINNEISFKIFNSFYNDLFNKGALSLNYMSNSKRKGKPRIESESLIKVFNLALNLLLKDKDIELSNINPYSVSYSSFDFFDLLISLVKADFLLENPLKLDEYNFNGYNSFKYKEADIKKFVNSKGFNYIINSLFRSESGKMYLIDSCDLNVKYKSRLINVDFNDVLDSGVFTESCLDRLEINYYEKFKHGNFSLIYLNGYLNVNKNDSKYLFDMYSRLVDYNVFRLVRKNLIRYLDIESSIDLNVVSFMHQKRNKELEKKFK